MLWWFEWERYHSLTYLNALSSASGLPWEWLLEEVSLGLGFEALKALAMPSVTPFMLPDELDVELSTPYPVPYLPVCCHVSRHDDIELNL